jgi:hypothetical protein
MVAAAPALRAVTVEVAALRVVMAVEAVAITEEGAIAVAVLTPVEVLAVVGAIRAVEAGTPAAVEVVARMVVAVIRIANPHFRT